MAERKSPKNKLQYILQNDGRRKAKWGIPCFQVSLTVVRIFGENKRILCISLNIFMLLFYYKKTNKKTDAIFYFNSRQN